MPIAAIAPMLATSLIGAGLGYAQYRKGIRDSKRIDEMGMVSYQDKSLPEYREVEDKYKQISQTGLGQSETNEFLRGSNSALYAQQLNAQRMAGGSLARYTLALNNANLISTLGTLSAQNFGRKMQGLQGYTNLLGVRQARVDKDIMTENNSRQMAGQAASGLARQGLQNIAGAFGSASTMLAMSGGFGGGANRTAGTNGKADTKTSSATGGNEFYSGPNLNTDGSIIDDVNRIGNLQATENYG